MRRILQAHKNNVVAVVRAGTSGTIAGTAEAILHGRRRLRIAAESSEWSDDDESVEPSSLLDDGHRESRHAAESVSDGGGSVVTADTTGGDGDGYTTGGDGDGYTTTGYTTDDAVADKETDMMAYVTGADLPVTCARQLDDNLSTINDTGLTDAEGFTPHLY